MTLLARLRSFLRTLLRPGRSARELHADLAWHLAERTDDLVRRGLPLDQAVRQARRELGDPLRWTEQGREARGLRLVDELWADLRFGARGLRRSPVFALSAILSVGLGIGANAAIFSLVNVVLLRSLPLPAPDRLTVYATTEPSGESGRYFSYRAFRALEEHATVADTTALAPLSMTLTTTAADEVDPTVTGYMVAGNYFAVLGVPLARGRSLQTSDDHPAGATAVAVLTYTCWQRRFGGDQRVLGSVVRLNGLPLTVVGVAAPGFLGTDLARPADLFVPLALQPLLMAEERRGRVAGSGIDDLWLVLIGRLKAGVTPFRAAIEMEPTFHRALLAAPGAIAASDPRPRLRMEPGRAGLSDVRQQLARPLLLLMAAVAVVLLIACANVANLLLARAGARRREMALRVSLGAGRARLVRQLLTESLLLALLGGAVGLLVAVWAGRLLPRLLDLDHVPQLEAGVDPAGLGFTLLVSIATAVLFGLAPALIASQTSAAAGLRARDATGHGGGRFGSRNVLVAAQVALAVVLLVGAGLFMRTLINVGRVELGFDRARVLTLRLEPRGSNQKSQNEAGLRRIYGLLLQGVERLPGVRAASLAGATPLSDENTVTPRIVAVDDARPGGLAQPIRMMQVYPNYLQAAGIPLLAGRDLTAADDTPEAAPVAVINHTLAARFGGRHQAVGRAFSLGPGRPTFEIVGVSGDVRDRSLREVPAPMAYATFAKAPTGRGQMTLIVRTAIEPSQLSTSVQQLAARIDPTMPRARLQTIEDRVAAGSREERMLATLAGVFGGVALLLAAIGVYGVLAYSVARRRVEFGIRLTLGLTPSRLRRRIVMESCAVVLTGLLTGTAAAVALAHALSGLLFGVTPLDPFTLGVVCAALMTVAVVAAWVPARAAARVDPALTLRQ